MKNYKNPLIFVVDDDPAFQKLIEKTLQSKRYKRIRTFSSGNECLEKINEEQPDVIFMDYEMPGLNGHETMKKIKELYPEIQFIFLSGQSNVATAVDIIKDGAFDYIVKDEAAQDNIINRFRKLLHISRLELEQKALKSGKKIFLIALIITWSLFVLLIATGIIKM